MPTIGRGHYIQIYQQHNHAKQSIRGERIKEVDTFTHFYNRSLPGQSGSAAKKFQTTYGIPTQRQKATDFYAFLRQDTIQPLELNADTISILALVNIPSSSKVQLVFGIGFGLRIIGALSSKIANKYVMLSGEGEPDFGCQNVLTLPASIHQPAYIATMNIKHFRTKLI